MAGGREDEREGEGLALLLAPPTPTLPVELRVRVVVGVEEGEGRVEGVDQGVRERVALTTLGEGLRVGGFEGLDEGESVKVEVSDCAERVEVVEGVGSVEAVCTELWEADGVVLKEEDTVILVDTLALE